MAFVWILVAVLVNVVAGQFDLSLVSVLADGFTDVDVTSECRNSLMLYVDNLKTAKEDRWALRMLDATSKVPVGLLFSFNLAELGDFTQCITTQSEDGLIQPKYCLGSFNLPSNATGLFRNDIKSYEQQVHLRRSTSRMADIPTSKVTVTPTWAICLPSNCTDDDVKEILSLVLEPEKLVCQTREDVYPPLTTRAIFTLAILAFFVLLIAVSTAYDLYCQLKNSEPSSQLYIAFSAYTNGRKLFKINKNSHELACLNGIRVLSMMWVVLGHVFSTMAGVFPVLNFVDIVDWANSASSMIFVSGTLSVDTFFVVGGALLVISFLKARQNGVKFNIFQFYLHRYLRLTPPLAVAVLVSATLLEYMGSGPNWSNVIIAFQENCERYWWSTLLYIQNYVNVGNFCVGQTWYLNMDMQLYMLSPLFLFPLIKYPRIGMGLVTACISASIAASFYIAYDMELSGILTTFAYKGSQDEYMNNYYLRTHTRAAPWFIGVILGYWLAKFKLSEDGNTHFKIKPKLLILVIWATCIAVIFTCIYGGHSTLRGPDYDRLGNSFYIAFVRPIWALCVAWVIFACSMGYGGPINWVLSLPIYQVLNRFTYSLYILHVTIIHMIGFASKRGVHFSIFYAAYSFWGLYMITFMLSVFWVLAFESPVITLEKFIFKQSNRRVNVKRTSHINGSSQ